MRFEVLLTILILGAPPKTFSEDVVAKTQGSCEPIDAIPLITLDYEKSVMDHDIAKMAAASVALGCAILRPLIGLGVPLALFTLAVRMENKAPDWHTAQKWKVLGTLATGGLIYGLGTLASYYGRARVGYRWTRAQLINHRQIKCSVLLRTLTKLVLKPTRGSHFERSIRQISEDFTGK